MKLSFLLDLSIPEHHDLRARMESITGSASAIRLKSFSPFRGLHTFYFEPSIMSDQDLVDLAQVMLSHSELITDEHIP